ncbi:MAG: prepilin-type N-terminal cleavage/methylation domain-containing protein [Pseudomonadota bacterium]
MQKTGFTLVELIIVIVVLGILAVVAAPKFLDVGTDAKIASIRAIASQMEATTTLVQNKARASGLRPTSVNPFSVSGNPAQTDYIVDFGFGRTEVHYSSLCPESIAEAEDGFQMLDFMQNSLDERIETRVDNQYTLVGYEVPASGVPTDEGCYVIYDSFADDDCSIEIVIEDC